MQVELLRYVGGNGVKKTIKAQLERLFTVKRMGQMSLKGQRGGKFALIESPLYRILVRAARLSRDCTGATESDIKNGIGEVLKRAPGAKGGIGRGGNP